MDRDEFMQESWQSADDVIETLKQAGHDYSNNREEIAELFDEYLYNGNYDMTLEFSDKPDSRFIQEDEFDQHMDDDEDVPKHEDQLCYAAGHYIFPA
jgi:hypothetical protein